MGDKLSSIRAAVEHTPDGVFAATRAAMESIGNAIDSLIGDFRAAGFEIDNGDGAYRAEGALLDWLHASNSASEIDAAVVAGRVILYGEEERAISILTHGRPDRAD